MLNVRAKSKSTGTWPNRSDKIGKRGLRTNRGLSNYPKTLSSPGFYGGYTPFSDSY